MEPHAGGLVSELVILLYPYLVAIGLGMARPIGLFLMLPAISRATLGAVVQGGIAFAVALPSAEPIRRTLASSGMGSSLPLMAYGAKEVIVGIILGVMLGIPVWAIQSVGELVDVQRGQTSGQQSDPGGGGQMSTLAGMLSQGAIGLFVVANGLAAVCSVLYGSYRVWPLLQLFPTPDAAATPFFLGLMDHISHFAVVVGGPIVILLLVVDLACILIARSVPKLGITDLIPTLKNLVFLGGMTLYLVFLIDYSAQEIEQVRIVEEQFRALFGGPAP